MAVLAAPACALLAVAAANAAVVDGAAAPAKVSMRAAVLMALGASLAAGAAATPFAALASVPLLAALAYFAAFDVRYLAVPVWPLAACTLAGIAAALLISPDLAAERASAAAAGGVIFVGLDWIYRALRGASGLGFGDALAAALIGAWLSWEGLIWSVALGASAGVIWTLARRRTAQPMPFVPALAVGAALYLVLRPTW